MSIVPDEDVSARVQALGGMSLEDIIVGRIPWAKTDLCQRPSQQVRH